MLQKSDRPSKNASSKTRTGEDSQSSRKPRPEVRKRTQQREDEPEDGHDHSCRMDTRQHPHHGAQLRNGVVGILWQRLGVAFASHASGVTAAC